MATFTLSGNVADGGGDPVANVTIELDDGGTPTPTTTDPTGAFSFFGIDEHATVALTPSAPGYAFDPANYSDTDVTADDTTITFVAEPLGLGVHVIDIELDDDGAYPPLPDVAVTLTGDVYGVGGNHQTQTDDDGQFSFSGLTVGSSYSISLTLTSYTQAAPAPFTFTAADVNEFNLGMYWSANGGSPDVAVWDYIGAAFGGVGLVAGLYAAFFKTLVEGAVKKVGSALGWGASAADVEVELQNVTIADALSAAGSSVTVPSAVGNSSVLALLQNGSEFATVASKFGQVTADQQAVAFVNGLVDSGAGVDPAAAIGSMNTLSTRSYAALMNALQTVRGNADDLQSFQAATQRITDYLASKGGGIVTNPPGKMTGEQLAEFDTLDSWQDFLDFFADNTSTLYAVSQAALASSGVIAGAAADDLAALLGFVLDIAFC